MWRSLAACILLSASALAGPKIAIVIGGKAPPLDRVAAEQLAADFKALFDAEAVVHAGVKSAAENVVLVGSPQSNDAIPRDVWPKIGAQGIVLRSTKEGLIVGGGSPSATVWAASELAGRFGVRHLLQGDVMPIEKPAFKLDGFDIVVEPRFAKRGWSMFNGSATGGESWDKPAHVALLRQLVKLKFTHVLIPSGKSPVKPMAVDGDTGGRKAFAGARQFPAGESMPDIAAEARDLGLVVLPMDPVTLSLGAGVPSVLPQFSLAGLERRLRMQLKHKSGSFMAGAQMPGDLNAAACFASRVCFDEQITAARALSDLVTPICGEGVAGRMEKGFDSIGQAAKLIEANDPNFGVPGPMLLLRHLESKEALPAWISEAKTHYVNAMNEMYRANTRAREGARTFTLYHAKRLEFTVHFFTAVEALYKAHDAGTRAESLEAAVEAIYHALNSCADVARDPSDRGAIALLNEHGYRALLKVIEAESK